MTLYKTYENTISRAILPLNNWGGIEILDVIYGTDDYIVACFNWGTGRQQIRRHKVCHTAAGRAYFWKNHKRYYLDDIMRINFYK